MYNNYGGERARKSEGRGEEEKVRGFDSLYKLAHDLSESLHSEVRVQHGVLPLLTQLLGIAQTRTHVDNPASNSI